MLQLELGRHASDDSILVKLSGSGTTRPGLKSGITDAGGLFADRWPTRDVLVAQLLSEPFLLSRLGGAVESIAHELIRP